MTVLQGAPEPGAPLSRLHERQSCDLADFPAPTGREEEWRFTPLRPAPRAAGRYGAARVQRSPRKPIPHPRSLPPVPNGASFVRRERRNPPRSGQSVQLRCNLTRACYDSGPAEA